MKPIYFGGGGFGRGPRRGFGGGFFILFLLFLAPELLLSGGFIFLLGPVLLGLAIYGIVKGIMAISNNSSGSRTENYFKNKSSKVSSSTQQTSNLSNSDLTRIDKKLENYYKKNVALPVINDVALVTTGGAYTSYNQLFLTYKNEKICRLVDFREDNPEMYNKIIHLLAIFAKQPDTVMSAKVETPEIKKEAILSNAEKYIEKINALNAQIPQEEITNGLYQTCDLLSKIEKSKSSVSDEQKLDKLYDYYLPILVSILENYKKLQDSAIKGEEFKNSEAQLIKTIILINEALKTIYANMHEDDYLNINADINTLQTLLEKDGYGEDPFATKEK